MKYYVGQIIDVDETAFGSSGKFSILGMVTDRSLYYFNSFDGQIVIHTLDVKDAHLEIKLNDDGEPLHGDFIEKDKAMDRFLQLIKDLKRNEKNKPNLAGNIHPPDVKPPDHPR